MVKTAQEANAVYARIKMKRYGWLSGKAHVEFARAVAAGKLPSHELLQLGNLLETLDRGEGRKVAQVKFTAILRAAEPIIAKRGERAAFTRVLEGTRILAHPEEALEDKWFGEGIAFESRSPDAIEAVLETIAERVNEGKHRRWREEGSRAFGRYVASLEKRRATFNRIKTAPVRAASALKAGAVAGWRRFTSLDKSPTMKAWRGLRLKMADAKQRRVDEKHAREYTRNTVVHAQNARVSEMPIAVQVLPKSKSLVIHNLGVSSHATTQIFAGKNPDKLVVVASSTESKEFRISPGRVLQLKQGDATLCVGHEFTAGPNRFIVHNIRRDRAVLKGTAGPVKGREFKIPARPEPFLIGRHPSYDLRLLINKEEVQL